MRGTPVSTLLAGEIESLLHCRSYRRYPPLYVYRAKYVDRVFLCMLWLGMLWLDPGKWENNYLIITFNAEARITLCTEQYSTLQYRGYQDTPGPGEEEGLQSTNDMIFTRDNNNLFSSLKILQ